MNGLLFPGQGAQSIGMGKNLYDNLPSARILLEKADELLGFSLSNLMFNGPQEMLTQTQFAQPAIFVCSAMYLEKIKADGIDYEYVAGHSLGEYDALLAAGVFDFETGLKLVSARGETMARMNGKGAMAAVMGMEEAEFKKYMLPDVVMANLNSKTQIVISGDEDKIDAIGAELEANDAVKFKKLRVSGAFHSPQMASAAADMKNIIEKADMKAPKCYVISNVTGRPTKDLAEIKGNLIEQITGQVRWYDTIISMKEAGVSLLYEVGNGDVLKKLNKTITFRPKCVGVEL